MNHPRLASVFLISLSILAMGIARRPPLVAWVVGPRGGPVEGARVRIVPRGCLTGADVATLGTDAMGRFESPVLPEDAEIVVEQAGHAPTIVRAVDGMTVRLPIPASVSGSVPGPAHISAWLGHRCVAQARVSGGFDLGPLPPGEDLQILVSSDAHRPWSTRLRLGAGESRSIDVRLDAGLSLAGRIQPPRAGVVLHASQGETRESVARSGEDGSFRLAGLRAGPVRVVALGNGKTAVVDGFAGGTLEVDLEP